MCLAYETEVNLGQAIFGHAQLGDRRRTARLVETFNLMQRHPGGTLPDKLSTPADLRAFYRLCDADEVTHEAIISAARQYTVARIADSSGPVLIVHDATELDYSSLTSLADDLGQIGKGNHLGYICHNVLAVAADTGDVLGLVDQILHCRDEAPENETLREHRERETRESLLWLRGTEHLPADAKLIDVADQGSDTFEFLEHEFHSGRRFVLRVYKVRKVYAGHQPVGRARYLKEYAHGLTELGRFTMDVQAQSGRKARKAAEFIVRGGPVLVCPPHAKQGHHGDDPLPLYVVQITEADPPAGEKAIDWTLLTNEPVRTFADAWRVSGWYERRWIVEEYHKAQKTGCQIEDMQFTTTARLEPAIALLSVVAGTLLNLRDASRRPDATTRRATTVLAPDYVTVLSLWRYREVRKDLTVHDFFYALARLGGHQNRKRDARPGWLVLWRGWTKLQAMLDGYTAARQTKCGKT
jgi:transposase-like protein